MTSQRDKRLVKRLKARDERAFRVFVDRHQDDVFNLVYRMLGSREEAEDVSQEVFVTVFKKIDSFRGQSRLSTWLYRIAVNHAKNRLKYLARRKIDQRETFDYLTEIEISRTRPGTFEQPEALAIGREVEVMLQKAIAQIDQDHRLIILLRDAHHLSYDEITEITGLPMGTVKSRLHRARASLRQALARVEKTRRRK